MLHNDAILYIRIHSLTEFSTYTSLYLFVYFHFKGCASPLARNSQYSNLQQESPALNMQTLDIKWCCD